jgi:hypothetical protein
MGGDRWEWSAVSGQRAVPVPVGLLGWAKKNWLLRRAGAKIDSIRGPATMQRRLGLRSSLAMDATCARASFLPACDALRCGKTGAEKAAL